MSLAAGALICGVLLAPGSARAETPTPPPLPASLPASSAPAASRLVDRKLLPLLQRLAQPALATRRLTPLIRAAGRTHDTLMLGPLSRLQRDRRASVRAAAATALGELQQLAALPYLYPATRDTSVVVARAAVGALGRYPLPKVREYLEQLATSDALPRSQRVAAVAALARHRTDEARQALGRLTAQSGDGVVGAFAGSAARQMQPCDGCREPRHVVALLDLLGAGDVAARVAALGTLVQVAAPADTLGPLLYASRDSAPALRMAALERLALHPAPAAEKRLIEFVEQGIRTEQDTAQALLLPREDKRPAVRRAIIARAIRMFDAPAADDQRLALEVLVRRVRRPAARAALLRRLRRPRQPYRQQALQALAPLPGSDLDATLRGIYRRGAEPSSLRVAAANALVARRTPGTLDLLWAGRKDGEPQLAQASLRLLEQNYPKQLATRLAALPKPPDHRGFYPLLAAGATLGTTAFYAMAKGAEGANPTIAALSGAVLGSGTAFLLARKREISLVDFGTFATVAGWTTSAGLSAGLAARLQRNLAWPVLGANIAGAVAGLYALRASPWDASDLAFVNVGMLQATVGGVGFALQLEHKERSAGVRTAIGITAGVLPLGVLAATGYAASRVEITKRDVGLIAHTSLLGTHVGALAGATFDARSVFGFGAMGEAAGYFGGVIASQASELSAQEQGWLWMTSFGASGIGGGLALMFPELHGRRGYGIAAGSALLGVTAGALTAERLSLRQRDLPLTLFGASYGAWTGAWLPRLWRDASDGRATGGGAMAAGLTGMIVGSVTSRLSDVPGRTVALMVPTSLAATSLGAGMGLLLPDLEDRGVVALMQSTSAAGVAASAALARHLHFSKADVGLTSLLSVYGGWSLAHAPLLWRGDATTDRDRVGGALAGAGAGALIGMAVSQGVELDGKDVAELATWSAGGLALGGGLGLLLDRGDRFSVAMMQGIGAAGLAAGAVLAPRLRYSARDAGLLAHLGAGGAAQGLLLADLGAGSPGQRAGGLLIGASGGLLAGALIAQYSEVDPNDALQTSMALVAGDVLGSGAALLANAGDRRARQVALATGSGLWLAGGLLAPHLSFSGRDGLLLASLTLGGAAQGTLLADLVREAPAGRHRGGGAMLGSASGMLIGAVLAQVSEMHPADVGQMTLSLLAGNALGSGLSLLTDRRDRDVMRVMLGTGTGLWIAGGLLAPLLDYSANDTLLTMQLASGGALQGMLLADLGHTPTGRQRGGGALVGASVAMMTGAALSQVSDMSAPDVGEMALGLLAGDAIGAGIGLVSDISERNVARLTLATGTALWAAAGLRAPYTTHTKADRALVGYLGAYGALLGAWVPALKHEQLDELSVRELSGGLSLGAGAGMVLGSLAAQHVELPSAQLGEIALISAGSSMFGAGLGLMADDHDDRPAVALMQAAGVGGTLAGAWLTSRTSYSGPDRLLTTLFTAYSGWEGVGLSLLFDTSDRRVGGAVMAAIGLGSLGGTLVSQFVDMTYTEVWASFSGSIWGAWLGGFSANLARNLGSDLSGRQIAGITALGSNVGIAASSLALSRWVGWTPERLGWINLSGLLGLSVGTGVGAIFSGESAQIGTIAGGGGGLIAGGIITAFMSFDRDDGAATASLGASYAGGTRARSKRAGHAGDGRPRSALGAVIADWLPTVRLEPDIDPATGEATDGMRFTVGVTGLLH